MARIRSPVAFALACCFSSILLVLGISCSETTIIQTPDPSDQAVVDPISVEINSLYEEWGTEKLQSGDARLAVQDIFVYGGDSVQAGASYNIAVRDESAIKARVHRAEVLLRLDLQIPANSDIVACPIYLDNELQKIDDYIFYEITVVNVEAFENFVLEIVVTSPNGDEKSKFYRGE